MSINRILKLGNQKLYEKSAEVSQHEIVTLKPEIDALNGLILEFRATYGVGRGIAAPQIGLQKRIICLNIENERHTLINPKLTYLSAEMMEIWDDCMCFPNLLVKVKRHKTCSLTFKDENWQEHTWHLEDELSELIQHEYDHLDGILATQRAIDNKSFKLK
jgi:peptide deformylase